MKKQSAVGWLVEQLTEQEYVYWDDKPKEMIPLISIIEQAKEMEKQQMWEYIKKNYCIGHRSLEFHRLEFEQYYEETYGGGDK